MSLDAAALRARLAPVTRAHGRRDGNLDGPGPDPEEIAEPAGSDDALDLVREPLIPAAVLVPIVLAAQPFILLTKRTAHLSRHGGQVSLPGGRIDPQDADAEAAALREAEEEVGLSGAHVEVLGRLRDYVTGTGFLVTPVIGLVDPVFRPAPSTHEVESVLSLPLTVLLDPAAPKRRRAHFRGRWREFWVWPHPEHEIWGATAAILVDLAQRLIDGPARR